MTAFGDEARRLMGERGCSLRELARQANYDNGYLSKVLTGHKPVTAGLAARIDDVLGAGGELAALADGPPASGAPDDDEIAALELARRAQASDVGEGTAGRLEFAADDLATAYQGTPPADLAEIGGVHGDHAVMAR